jgi:hypothetical protein
MLRPSDAMVTQWPELGDATLPGSARGDRSGDGGGPAAILGGDPPSAVRSAASEISLKHDPSAE